MMVPGSHIGHQKMVLIRCSKILLVASVALFTTLVVFNNITDYGSNYAVVEHVLRMDTTFPNNKGMWRAITFPTLHHAAYMLIILVEGITALLCWAGAVKLLGALRKGVIEFLFITDSVDRVSSRSSRPRRANSPASSQRS